MPTRYTQTERGEIEIFPSRLKLLGLALLLILFAASSFFALSAPDLILRISGIFVAVFFGIGGAFVIHRLIVHGPAVRLTPDGILDNSSLAAAGFVPWSDIVFAAPVTVSHKRMLGFFLKDPESFLRSRSWPKASMLRLNLRLGFPVVAIPADLLPAPVDEFALELAARFPVRIESSA